MNGENAKLPARQSDCAAGYDLYSAENVVIASHARMLVDTQIIIEIPNGYYGRISPRSGLSLRSIDIGAGVIGDHSFLYYKSNIMQYLYNILDSDYRGNIKVLLINNNEYGWHLQIGDRIAQLIIQKIITPDLIVMDSLSETKRGDHGFGSTGL